MSGLRIMNIFFWLLLASIAAFAYYVRDNNRKKARLGEYPREKVRGSFIEPGAMLVFILFYIGLSISVYYESGNKSTFMLLLLVLVYIGAYYGLLLCLMPFLRRVLDINACAALWVLPGIAYCLMSYALTVEPIFMITLPQRLIKPAITIWFYGMALVLGYQIISHFAYRRSLKKSVIQKVSPDVTERWQSECRRLGIKRKIPAYISENITTPVTVGLAALTMRLYLPNRSYTEEELGFIIRHEAQHVARGDTRNKLFLGFITAVNWFNPLSWIAMKRAAEDFELSCDEEVLCNACPYERKAYAELILRSADTSRGYSTCLSASAKSLKYRLGRIMNPGKRFGGTLAVFIAILILMLGMGTVGIADSAVVTLGDVISLPEDAHVEYIYVRDGWELDRNVYGCDDGALIDYVSSLRIKEVVYGNLSSAEQDRFIEPRFIGEGYFCNVTVFDGYLSVRENQYRMLEYYILADEVDWEYIYSLLDYSAENPNTPPVQPWLYLDMDFFDEFGNEPETPFKIMGEVVKKTVSGEMAEAYWGDDEEVRFLDCPPNSILGAKISFNYEPRDGYAITVENWDRTESYTLTSDELVDGEITIEPYSAHYTIEATFDTNMSTTYVVKFHFGVHYGSDEITG